MNKNISFKDRMNKYYGENKELMPDFPKNMLLEVTNACNHSCVFCANSKMTRKKSLIDFNFACRILKEAYDLGTREVGFYSTGEPLINKDLEQYIKLAKDIGYEYVYITTNGALLMPERARSIVESGIDSIKFSINAGTKEKYLAIHGQDNFEEVYNNLKYLFEYRKEHELNFKIFVSCILTKYTAVEKEMFVEKFNKISDDIVFLNCKNQCGVMYEINNLLEVENTEDSPMSTYCPLPFNKLHITCEGYITACCADFQNYLAVADLNNTKLIDAWNNEIFIQLRRRHIENTLEGTLCFNCVENKNDKILPLESKLSAKIDDNCFNKRDEIIDRIKLIK